MLKDGLLTEVGNHESLLRDYPNGTYAGFVEKQKNAEENDEEEDEDLEKELENK